ncbi:MAG: hypothetical protein II928_03555 [Paludibacteraceae bacterium]|nr:hypothetical protein [Paludibacteraceae bacterium]
MKKLLYVALAALMLISCDPNAPKVPSKDNKAVDNVSKNILSLLGEKKKAAVSTLEDLGFEKITLSGALPQRLGLPAQKADDPILYLYGNLDVYEEAMEDEDLEALVDYLNEKKEIMILAQLILDSNGKVALAFLEIIAPAEVKNINSLYAKFSKNVFLSLGDGKEWEGVLVECDDINDEDAVEEFTSAKKRDKFDEAFAAMECPYAQENGSDEFDDDANRTYESQWIGDASVMEKDMDGLAVATFLSTLQAPETPEP